MSDDDHSLTSLPDQPADIRGYHEPGLVIQGAEGFIQKEQLGIQGKGADQGSTLLHAAGQFAGTFILKAFQTIVGQKLFHIVGTLFGKSMMDLQSQSDILVDGTPFEEMIVLQHIADTGIVKGSVGIVDYDGAGLLQGFRVVGSGSKLGREYPVRAFRLGGPVELARLLDYIPDSNGEQQRLEGLMRKSRLSLAEAKEKYPDWYERRIIKKERRGRWTVKRDLYDWWLHRIADEIRVGHRFYGIMTLAIYAKKCGIDEDELRRDAFALLRPYDDMSVEDINRFTKDDVVCALEMFNEDYVTFPRDDIAKLSGLTMPVNKRNWRKQPVHLQGARAIQEINDKANGTNWREGNGRPKGSGTAQARVYEWRQQHPEGRKADCHRETGLDPKTVRKWWDCPPPAVRFENGHITVRVSPSQELSDWLLDALHDGGQE